MPKYAKNHSQLIHIWAQRPGPDFRQTTKPSGGGMPGYGGEISVKVEGDTVYSYGHHWAMGRHVDLPAGNPTGYDSCVFLNYNRNSLTTNKHQDEVNRAVSHRLRLPVNDPSKDAPAEMAYAREAVKSTLEQAARADKRNRPKYLVKAQALANQANDVAEAFGLDKITLPTDVEVWLAEEAKRAEATKKAAREKWAADNAANVQLWSEGRYEGHYGDEFRKIASPEQLAAREVVEEKAALLWKDRAESDHLIPTQYNLPERTLLRLAAPYHTIGLSSKDSSEGLETLEIETSRGARFPIGHAKKAFRALELMKRKGWLPYARGQIAPECGGGNGFPSLRLGHFTIDKVDEVGNVTAGCHFVEWRDIEDMAWRLGLVSRDTTNECPGHVASASDPKICGRCGTHIDELRPDDDYFGVKG